MPTRRSFLKQASLATTGLLIFKTGLLRAALLDSDLYNMGLDNAGLNNTSPFRKGSPIGLQLYTLRHEIDKDLPGTLQRVSGIGYTDVEVFGYKDGHFFGLSPADFAALLKKNGLVSPSGHYSLPNYLGKGDEEELKRTVADAKALSHEYLTIPWLPENLRTSLDDYKTLVGRLNKAGQIVKDAGMKLAYHNHNFEFKDWGGGQTGFDILVKESDPSLVNFEMDIYWVTKAGMDPIQLIKAHPGRFVMWHVKDMDSTPDKSFTEVGSGIINYKEIFKYKKESGMKRFFIEQDEVKIPVYDSITKSFQYIRDNILHA
ncbi:MAG: sugar phosphate isomerase/epimerase [Puia sp.]|nr:sugar phosphate isomerase/epimerase [Puia sp.]